jgi:asparagine synthase (glutamine-hydrolysing)
MCGIAGQWAWSGVAPEESVIAAMIDLLHHRGPEGRTCWFSSDRRLALAHAQLSFFKGGEAQPVSNGRNSIFAICNGEIYNHRELTRLLRQSGLNPDVRSDVGVIPYIYELRGPSCFAMLQGEFALALFDSEKQALYLVRDRFGIKPLCYHITAGSVAFASEIKALFANPDVPRALDNQSVATKLFGITIPGTTAFSSIRDVKPGAYLELTASGISEQGYSIPRLQPSESPKDLGELAHDFLPVFDEAVRIRLHGDFPIGAYLSGGIDSSAVLASMVHSGAKSLKAFTISFDDKSLDESPIAVRTAARLGVEHHLVRVSDRDIAENFLDSIWHSEIPVINCHGTAKFILSRAASAHVKAIMTGEGADELFAGYDYFGANIEVSKQPGFGRQVANWYRMLRSDRLAAGFLALPRENDIDRLKVLFACAPHLGVRALFYGRWIRKLLNRDFRRYFSPLGALELIEREMASDNVGAMSPTNLDRFVALRYDLPAYLLNFLGDRQEMAHSVEGRVPFLDDKVVAFAAALREESLVGEAAGKKLIRAAFAGRLPPETVGSKKKIFLAPPTGTDEIIKSDWAHHMLSRSVTETVGVFDWRKLEFLRTALKLMPAHSGLGSAVRSLMILVISLHALHHLFVLGRSRADAAAHRSGYGK